MSEDAQLPTPTMPTLTLDMRSPFSGVSAEPRWGLGGTTALSAQGAVGLIRLDLLGDQLVDPLDVVLGHSHVVALQRQGVPVHPLAIGAQVGSELSELLLEVRPPAF